MVKLLLCSLFIFVFSQILEYRFLTNFGEVFYDYSNSKHHAVNGDSSTSLDYNARITDRGIFLKGNAVYVKPPPNDVVTSASSMPSSFSIDCWTKVEDTDNGLLYYKAAGTSTKMSIKRLKLNQVLQVIIDDSNIISGSANSFPSGKAYSGLWVLISVTYSSNKVSLLKNRIEVSSLSLSYSELNTCTSFIGHQTESTIKGFISLFSILDFSSGRIFIESVQSTVCLTLEGSCETPCNPTIIINSLKGCISLENDPTKDSRSFSCYQDKVCSAGVLLSCSVCSSKSCSLNPFTTRVECFNDLNSESTTEILPTCIDTHLLSNSKCCYKECTSCLEPYSEKCQGCVDSNAQIANFRCSCKSGYGGVHPLISGSCVMCKNACGSCTNNTMCLTCKDSNAQATSGGCVCKEGYFGQTTLNFFIPCTACRLDCKTCGDATNCNTCISQNAYSDSSSPSGCRCNSGYSGTPPLNRTDSCTSTTACHSSCISCISNVCKCNPGYFPNTSGVCTLCHNFCLECQTVNSCNICKTGYFKQALSDGTFSCSQCSFTHCLACEALNSCSSCKASNTVLNGNQGCKCKDGYFANNPDLDTSNACLPCHGSCVTCIDSSPCLTSTCNFENSIKDSSGVCVCRSGFYLDSTTPNAHSCLSCHSDCMTCSQAKLCVTCRGNSVPSLVAGCICPLGTYSNSASNGSLACQNCPETCKECLSENFCIKCQVSNLQPDLNGKCFCPVGSYFSKKSNNLFECATCNPSCSACEDLESCLSCSDPSKTLNKLTGNCVKDCKQGFLLNQLDVCICNDGTYETLDQHGQPECLPCEEPCKTCANQTACSTCIERYQLDDGKCLIDCEKGSFFNGNNCEKCDELCIECKNSSFCISCVESAEMVNNSCKCSFLLRGKCFLNYFSFSLLKESNRIFLVFNESVNETLNETLMNASISARKSFSYTISKLSFKKFVITLKLSETIPKNTTFTVNILKFPFFSSKGSVLLEYKKEIQLDELVFYEPNPLVKGVSKLGKPLAQTSVSTGLGVSLISNPASAWLLINTLQLIMYLPISQNSLTLELRNFCTSFGDINFLPNPLKYFFSDSSSAKPSKRQQETGISTSVFLINGGQNLGVILLLLALYPLLLMVSKCSYGRFSLSLIKVLKNYKYGVFLRYWIQAYLELGIFSLIQIKSEIDEPYGGNFNLAFATVCILLVALSPAFLFVCSYVSFHRIMNNNDSEFASMYGSLFDEFRIDKGFFSCQYYTLFFIRRLAYILAHFYLDSMPILKIGFHISFTIIMLIFLFLYRPYKETSIFLSSLFGEFAALIAFIISLMLYFEKFQDESKLEVCFVYSVIFTIIFQTLIGIYEFCKSLLQAYKKFEKKRALAFKAVFEASRDQRFSNP